MKHQAPSSTFSARKALVENYSLFQKRLHRSVKPSTHVHLNWDLSAFP